MPTAQAGPTRGYWIISGLALVWNLIGIMTFVMTVTLSDAALAAMPEAERALYEGTPGWVTAAYAVAVFAGTAGCVGLLLRKAWATPTFVVSLIAIIGQMGHALLASSMLEVQGSGAAVLPIMLIAIAAGLVAFARSAGTKGWLD